MAKELGVHSEIDLAERKAIGHTEFPRVAAREAQSRPANRSADWEQAAQRAGSECEAVDASGRRPSRRRSAFAGIKLNRAQERSEERRHEWPAW